MYCHRVQLLYFGLLRNFACGVVVTDCTRAGTVFFPGNVCVVWLAHRCTLLVRSSLFLLMFCVDVLVRVRLLFLFLRVSNVTQKMCGFHEVFFHKGGLRDLQHLIKFGRDPELVVDPEFIFVL